MDKNWAADASSTKTGGGTGNQGATGTPSNAFDGNESTSYAWDDFCSAGGCSSMATLWVQSDFAVAHSINRIKAVIEESGWESGGGTYAIKAYYSGGWHTVQSGNTTSGTKQTIDITGLSLSGVTK